MAKKNYYLVRRKDRPTNRKPTYYARFDPEGSEDRRVVLAARLGAR